MAGKVSAEEYAKVKAAVAKNYTADSVKAYTNAYNSAKANGSTSKDAYNSASGLLVKNTSSSGTSSSGGTSSGGASSGGVSGNATSGGDIYGDVSKKATTNKAMDFSNYSGDKTLSSANALFGKDAEAREKTNSGFITSRNDTIAYELKNAGITDEEGIRSYLESKYDSYKNADQLDKDNTVNAIKTRLSEVTKNGETETRETTTFDANGSKTGYTVEEIDEKRAQAREGYYRNPDGSYFEIHGYQALCDAGYKNLIDGMSEEDKKYVSNLWDKGMQETIKAYLDNKRQDKQLREKQEINEDLYNINRETALIQSAQTLRQARESYDNLKQNWQYLGNMGMPGTSATKIQAIGDAISEAETTLNEIQKLTKLKLDAQEKEWEGQVLQYTQQIQNLQYDLDWKVSKEIQGLLGDFTTAELEGKLDTIDGITAFKKELLDKLNNNLSGITSASLQQMQYINQEYQDIADKMYEYAQNKNIVNTEMSAVKGYYVDGNGNPIFNAKGETIPVPQNPPLDPVYDKETGKLIVFGYDENGNITANVQNILGYENPYYTGQGTGLGGMRTERNNNPTAMTVDVAKSLGMVEGVDYVVGDSFKDSKGNTLYTAEIIGDPIETTIRAFDNAAAKGIGIFYTKNGGQRWTHTAMSNEDWMAMNDAQKRDTILKMLKREGGDINKMKFYNQEDATGGEGGSGAGYKEYDVPNYTNFLKNGYKAFSNADKEALKQEYGSLENFKQAALAYQDYVDGQVGEVAKDMMVNLNDIWKWLTNGGKEVDVKKYAELVAGVWGDGAMYKSKLNQLTSSLALQKLISLKADGATFGALSDQELGFITDASNWLKLSVGPTNFVNGLAEKLNAMRDYYGLSRADIEKLGGVSSWDTQSNNGGETTIQEEQIYTGGRGAFGK